MKRDWLTVSHGGRYVSKRTLARVIAAACRAVRAADGIRIVCLSGGSFQNMRLLEETSAVSESSGFEVFFPLEIPSNDGGLSLGRAVIANPRIGNRFIAAGPRAAGYWIGAR